MREVRRQLFVLAPPDPALKPSGGLVAARRLVVLRAIKQLLDRGQLKLPPGARAAALEGSDNADVELVGIVPGARVEREGPCLLLLQVPAQTAHGLELALARLVHDVVVTVRRDRYSPRDDVYTVTFRCNTPRSVSAIVYRALQENPQALGGGIVVPWVALRTFSPDEGGIGTVLLRLQ